MPQYTFQVQTASRGLHTITDQVRHAVTSAGIPTGLCSVFIHHTSASLLIQENADPDVQTDLEAFFRRLVPDGDPLYCHVDEGPDDMPAHVRSALTATNLTIPVSQGRLALGTWQGIFLWEHRTRAHLRTVTVTVLGEHQ